VKGGPWVAELTRRIEGPAVFTTFLLTQPARGMKSARAEYLAEHPAKWCFRQHDGISAHMLDLRSHGKLYVASCPYGRAFESNEFSTDAELAVALRLPSGKLACWALARGSRFTCNGKRLVCRRAEWVAST
jgi:hypothetical protein